MELVEYILCYEKFLLLRNFSGVSITTKVYHKDY